MLRAGPTGGRPASSTWESHPLGSSPKVRLAGKPVTPTVKQGRANDNAMCRANPGQPGFAPSCRHPAGRRRGCARLHRARAPRAPMLSVHQRPRPPRSTTARIFQEPGGLPARQRCDVPSALGIRLTVARRAPSSIKRLFELSRALWSSRLRPADICGYTPTVSDGVG